MDRARGYAATRRPSRLRDPYLPLNKAIAQERPKTNFVFTRNATESFAAPEPAFREASKRDYATRYRRYSAEDSYARTYERASGFPRRGDYGEEYLEYKPRSRQEPAAKRVPRDTAYPVGRFSGALRRDEGRAHLTYRVPETGTRGTRRSSAEWEKPAGDAATPPARSTARMQLRQDSRQQPYSTRHSSQAAAAAGTFATNGATPELVGRIRPPSPRIAKMRAGSAAAAEETEYLDTNLGRPINIKSEGSVIKVDITAVAEEAPANTQETATAEDAASNGVADVAPEVGAEATQPAEAPVKRKRGRPKLVRDPDVHVVTTPKRGKNKEMPSPAGEPASPPKRTSARIRSNATTQPIAPAQEQAQGDVATLPDESSVELPAAAVVVPPPAKEGTKTPKTTVAEARQPPADSTADSSSKTRDSTATSTDDDVNDVDYMPTGQAKRAVNRGRPKGASKAAATAASNGTKPTGRGRGGRRPKEQAPPAATVAEPLPQTIDPSQITDTQAQAVTVVNEGTESARMLIFEEYLDMSERMYCGQPLCIRVKEEAQEDVKPNGDATANGGAEGTEGAEGTGGTESTGGSEAPVDSTQGGTDASAAAKADAGTGTNGQVTAKEEQKKATPAIKANKATEARAADQHSADNVDEDELFEFHCSKLDLRYRVSFSMLTSAARQSQMLDLWGPKEIVLFELGMFKHGKEFYEIQRNIPTKTVQEIVDMYYFWKKTNRYKLWKANRLY